MRLVRCVIRPHKVDETIDAVRDVGVAGLMVTHAGGAGSHTSTAVYRGNSYPLRYLPRVVLDVLVEDDRVEDVIRVVMITASTGERDDGEIYVIPVDEAYTIRAPRPSSPDHPIPFWPLGRLDPSRSIS